MSKVLEGIRVLDFGRYIAGPYCATLLADLGADVIRIEKVDGSEDRFVSPVTETGDGAMFLQLGRNKRGLTLNPMKPEGREIVKKLVATADVVVANLPPDTLSAMGLDYESLTQINPDIILTMISAFGRGGPTRIESVSTGWTGHVGEYVYAGAPTSRSKPTRRSSILVLPVCLPSARSQRFTSDKRPAKVRLWKGRCSTLP